MVRTKNMVQVIRRSDCSRIGVYCDQSCMMVCLFVCSLVVSGFNKGSGFRTLLVRNVTGKYFIRRNIN